MRAGRLRHYVALAGPPAFISAGDVYAAIEPQKTAVDEKDEGLRGALPYDVWLRYDPAIAIKAGWRVVFGARLFEVVTEPLNRDERNQTLHLNCREYVGETVGIGMETGIAYIFRDVTRTQFGDGWSRSTEPHTEIELLQSQWSSKPIVGDEIDVSATGETFAIVDAPLRDDGIIWRFLVKRV